MKIIDRLKDKGKLKIYNMAREAYLKKAICDIGRIIEEEDKIICYVDQKALDRHKKSIYRFHLNGMNEVTDGIKETVQNFKLNKPVYYIFESIKFKTAIEFSSFWAHVIFRNCTFDKNIGIIWAEDVVFENNKYLDHCPIYFYGNSFLTGDRIKKITFINEYFFNGYRLKRYGEPANFGMNIDAELIEIINSKIEADNSATISIRAKKTLITKSEINANEVYIDSESIDFTSSYITAKSGIIIENANCDFVGKVQAPTTFYNGVDLSNDQEPSKINEDEKKLKESRMLLIKILRRLSDCCKQINENRIQPIKNDFDNEPVIKVLKQR